MRAVRRAGGCDSRLPSASRTCRLPLFVRRISEGNREKRSCRQCAAGRRCRGDHIAAKFPAKSSVHPTLCRRSQARHCEIPVSPRVNAKLSRQDIAVAAAPLSPQGTPECPITSRLASAPPILSISPSHHLHRKEPFRRRWSNRRLSCKFVHLHRLAGSGDPSASGWPPLPSPPSLAGWRLVPRLPHWLPAKVMCRAVW